MAINISSFFNSNNVRPFRRPLLNQVPTSATNNALYGISTVLTEKQKFWRWFRARPELNSPVMIRVDDTITEVDFVAVDGSPLGRNKLMKAKKFWDKNQLYERLKSLQFDRLVTGSGFLWHGKFSDLDTEKKEYQLNKIKEKFSNLVNSKIKLKSLDKDVILNSLLLKAIDEDIRSERFVDYVASSTVVIEHDKFDVTKYIQHFASHSAEFKPEEIIHIPLHRIDGKVDGFTPIESLYYELVLLWAIKENMLSFFRNGGVPNKLFILPDEISNSSNHQWLVNNLMDNGVLQNRHGNLVLTGNVEVKDLEGNPKDMEYKDLALYLTSNVAYALRVPVTRIPYLIGSAAAKSDAGGMAESGYWSMIESDQLTIEQNLNYQLLNKLGFMIKFRRHYKIDDLREAQAAQYRIDAITKARTELSAAGLMLTKGKLLNLLSGNDFNISIQDVEEDKMLLNPENTGLLNKSFASNSDQESPGKQEMDDTKRQGATNNPKGSNQTGF